MSYIDRDGIMQIVPIGERPLERIDNRPIRLAIVGSRDFSDPDAWDTIEQIISDTITRLDPVEVISGGARGVDTVAAQIAEDMLLEVTVYESANGRWEPNGYRERNQRIADECTHLLAIRCKTSKTYGSGWTRDYAVQQGKPCQTVMLD